MCVPVLAQVTCRHREKEAVSSLSNSQGTRMSLRSERAKSKAEVLLRLVQVKDPSFAFLRAR